MSISDIAKKISILNMPPDAFPIGDPIQDKSLCIREKNGSWEVFYHERGIKTELCAFKEEDVACENFLFRIKAWKLI
jgi:hypothetical protein